VSIKSTLMTAVCLLAMATQASAGETGFSCLEVPANTDSRTSVPFARACVATVTVASVSGSEITIDETINETAYDNGRHYVRFTDGDAEGRWSTITSNDADKLVVEDSDILSGVEAGDKINIYIHHTVGSVFPDEDEGVSFIASGGLFTNTQILIPSTADAINKADALRLIYVNGKWVENGGDGSSKDNTILPPQQYFTIRNNNNTTLTLYTSGTIEGTVAVKVPNLANANDLVLATGIPSSRTLGQLNLGNSSAFDNTSGLFTGDELQVFDPSETGQNKPASKRFLYTGTKWIENGGDGSSQDDFVIEAGAAVLIRKVSGAGATVFWVQPN